MTFDTFKQCLNYLAFIYILVLILSALVSHTPFGRDDSDKGTWGGERSNLSIRTDHLTGCQYLATSKGGITPRLDKHGNHICSNATMKGE